MDRLMTKFLVGAIAMMALVCSAGARADELDDLSKAVAACDELKAAQKKLDSQNERNLQALPASPGLPEYGKATVDTTLAQRKILSEFYGKAITQAEALISQAKQTTGEERTRLLRQAEQVAYTSRALAPVQINLGDAFKTLQRLSIDTNAARSNTDAVALKSAMDSAWPQDKAGGVFINQTAQISGLNRESIARAEFRLSEGRFVLHEKNGKAWLLPVMSPDMVTVVIKCLYFEAPPRREISVSLGIDPVNMGRKASSGTGYEKVLFGCEALHDTEVGRILIDADDANVSVWQGMNREGGFLTDQIGYNSLLQMTLDHPVNDQITKVEFIKRKIDMRVWIRPEKIVLSKSGENGLAFGPVPFRMFSETIEMTSPKSFTGVHVPNPGADAFTAFFSNNFSRFANFTLRRDEGSGSVRPLLEVQEVARIVSVVRWIKGEGLGKPQIPMDTSWVGGYRVKNVATDRELSAAPLFKILTKKIIGPIVIYNEYGPSRIIDKQGHTTRVTYENGHIKLVSQE